MIRVEYRGFLQTVVRIFATREAAETWTRSVGMFDVAIITDVKG